MVSIKVQSRGSIGSGYYFWNSNRHHHNNNSSNATTSSTNAATILGPPPPALVTLLQVPSSSSPKKQQQQRLLTTILLGTFVFITMVIPILRFLRYDDSHLFQSMLLLDTSTTQQQVSVSSTPTSKTTSSSSATVTLLDVALGKALLSDYVLLASSTSSSSSTFQQPSITIQIDHSDRTPLQQQVPSLRHATSDLLHDSAAVDEKVDEMVETKEEEEAEEKEDVSLKGETAEEVEEEEDVIKPTQRTIPPFSWEKELLNANNYIQSFIHVGRTSPTTISSKKKKKNQKKDQKDPYHDALLFFHIPKTAGTAIEYAAGVNPDHPLAWGSCRFNHKPKRDICHYPQNSKPCMY